MKKIKKKDVKEKQRKNEKRKKKNIILVRRVSDCSECQ